MAGGQYDISNEEYHLIKNLVYDKFGIDLGSKKQSLVTGRLQKILNSGGFRSFEDYYHFILADQSGQALSTLVDRISTNHTFFFRENEHFEFLRTEILPGLKTRLSKTQDQSIRIWSAGCSSGEEPYTLAIVLKEFFSLDFGNWDVRILATDISSNVLKRAADGIYPKEALQTLDGRLRDKYFTSAGNDSFQARPALKELVLFRRLNLMREDFPFRQKFHLILCRNVMIYFDQPTREILIEKFHRYLLPDSYLFIGHAESLGRGNPWFKYIKPAVYYRIGD